MIGRSFATEDAHDKIRAYVIELFEVIECEAEANLEQVGAVRRGAARRGETKFVSRNRYELFRATRTQVAVETVSLR